MHILVARMCILPSLCSRLIAGTPHMSSLTVRGVSGTSHNTTRRTHTAPNHPIFVGTPTPMMGGLVAQGARPIDLLIIRHIHMTKGVVSKWLSPPGFAARAAPSEHQQ